MKKLKRTIAIILCLVMANLSVTFADTTTNDYTNHWASATIQKWVTDKKITGYPDGTFKPDASITRAEFVKLANNAAGATTPGEIKFTDVKKGDWFYDAVSIAYKTGYITGVSATEFAPDSQITREEAAAILSRMKKLEKSAADVSKFTDNKQISAWATGEVGAAYKAGFISGYPDGTFAPQANLTRAEAVTMLDKLNNVTITVAGTKLKDTVVNGDLTIAKSVGEGEVYLENVEVKGNIYVQGGGENSVFFTNVKAPKVKVEKEKVRIVLDKGTVIQEVTVGSQTIVKNTAGQVGKITVTADGKVTLSGKFDSITVTGKATLVLDKADIKNLVLDAKATITGSGTIATMVANVNGITYASSVTIDKTTVGKDVTVVPAKETAPAGGGGSSSGGSTTTSSYGILVSGTVTTPTTNASQVLLNTKAYASTDRMSDFLVAQLKEVLANSANSSQTTKLQNYLDKALPRVKDVQIGGTTAYTANGFDRVKYYLSGTQYSLDTVQAQLLDDQISIADLVAVLDLYKTPTQADLDAINKNLASYPFATQLIKNNGEEVKYEVVLSKNGVVTQTFTDNAAVASFILKDLSFSTKTANEFFAEFGDTVTIKTTVGARTSTVTIQKNLIK